MHLKKSLKALFILNGVFVLASHLLGPLYAVFVQDEIGGTAFIVSVSWSVFIISSLIFTLFITKYGDRVKEREYLLAAGFLVRAISWALYIFATNLYALLAIQVLIGLGEALGSPAFSALLAQHINQKKAVREYAIWSIVAKIAAATSTAIGGIVVANYSFTPVFIAMTILALVSFLMLLRLPRRLL